MTVSAGAGSWVLLDGFNLFVQKPSRKKQGNSETIHTLKYKW